MPWTAASAVATQVENATGLAAIGNFFGRLEQANTWVCVGETILGLILIAVGLAKITDAVPVATAIAKKIGAVGLA